MQVIIMKDIILSNRRICKRADDLYGRDVMQDVYESILTSSVVIADITNRNANVFYELGIAHSLGKEVILLAQGSEHIPFDLNRFRHCIYSNDGDGYRELRIYIPEAIRDIFSKRNMNSKYYVYRLEKEQWGIIQNLKENLLE